MNQTGQNSIAHNIQPAGWQISCGAPQIGEKSLFVGVFQVFIPQEPRQKWWELAIMVRSVLFHTLHDGARNTSQFHPQLISLLLPIDCNIVFPNHLHERPKAPNAWTYGFYNC